MEASDILSLGAQILKNKLDDEGDGLDIGDITQALGGLMGGGADASNEASAAGGLDLGSLVSMMSGQGDLSSIVGSWLGDGDNAPISSDQVVNALGQDKVSAFANQLGVSEEKAVGGLQEALPQVVDKSSSGGSLLDMVGGVSGAINLASQAAKMFGRG